MADLPLSTGSCLCGAVTLTVSAKPNMMLQCHCLDCQKATGSGHASYAMFAEDDVAVEGEASEHTVTADSGSKMTRYFCPTCGGRVFGRNSARPGIISIPVGCLNDRSWYSPQAVIYASRRLDWDITSDEIPNFEKMPPPDS